MTGLFCFFFFSPERRANWRVLVFTWYVFIHNDNRGNHTVFFSFILFPYLWKRRKKSQKNGCVECEQPESEGLQLNCPINIKPLILLNQEAQIWEIFRPYFIWHYQIGITFYDRKTQINGNTVRYYFCVWLNLVRKEEKCRTTHYGVNYLQTNKNRHLLSAWIVNFTPALVARPCTQQFGIIDGH